MGLDKLEDSWKRECKLSASFQVCRPMGTHLATKREWVDCNNNIHNPILGIATECTAWLLMSFQELVKRIHRS